MKKDDVEKILNTMVILVDTREQETEEAYIRWMSFGLPYERQYINPGDYSAKVTLPDGESLNFKNKIVIERKMSLNEVCSNFGKYRQRFTREFNTAKKNGTKIYLLIEGGSWENVLKGNYVNNEKDKKYQSKMLPQSLFASLTTWMARYDCNVIFCQPETTPKIIPEILKREAKEILLNWGGDANVE